MEEKTKTSRLVIAFAVVFLTIGIFVMSDLSERRGGSEGASPMPENVMLEGRVLFSPHPRKSSDKQVSSSAAPREHSARLMETELASRLTKAEVVPNEALLTFESPEQIGSFRARAAGAGVTVIWSDGRILSARVSFRDWDDLAGLVSAFGDNSIEVAPNYLARIPSLPRREPSVIDKENAGGSEPFESALMAAIGADRSRDGWGDGVKVAVLDSGIGDHSTFDGLEMESISVLEDSVVSDGHGTAMASLIAGRGYPAEGVAPSATLLDVQVIGEEGFSNTGLLAEGILRAVDQGADVLNVSLAASGDSPSLRRAIEYATERQVVVIAAAGNEQQTEIAYPAAYPGVISVGAVDANLEQAYFSNSGENLTIAAPGVGVISAYTEDAIVIGSGTSQATAVTSGAVAAMLSWGISPTEIVPVMQESARPKVGPKAQVDSGVLRLPVQ